MNGNAHARLYDFDIGESIVEMLNGSVETVDVN